MRLFQCAFVLLALVALTGPSRGDDEKQTDEKFFRDAVSCGVAEVKISELAEKQAKNEEVREFARQMAREHSKHNKELIERAKDLKTAVVVGLDQKHKEKLERLSKLENVEFDREYMKQIIEGHQDAIKLFETQAKTGANADLKAFATESLPTLRMHLKKAQAISANLK